MTYSIDFRRKVSETEKQERLSVDTVAVRFNIGKSGASRWAKRPEPCRSRNKAAVKTDTEPPAQDAALYPDAYRHERAGRPGCSQRGISGAPKRLKISRKKNSSSSEGG